MRTLLLCLHIKEYSVTKNPPQVSSVICNLPYDKFLTAFFESLLKGWSMLKLVAKILEMFYLTGAQTVSP